MRKLLRARAFTMVELIVAVVILGVLSIVAILAYTAYVNNAKEEVAVSVVRQADNMARDRAAANSSNDLVSLDIDPVPDCGDADKDDIGIVVNSSTPLCYH